MELDMTKGRPLSLIIKFIIPVILGNLFQHFYTMVDTIIVGRFVGVDALAAVGATGSLTFLILGFTQGLTTGFTVLTAQRFGAGDREGMQKSIGNAVILSVIVTVVMTAVSMLGMDALLRVMNTPENIFDMTKEYIMILCAGICFNVLYNLQASILRAIGNSVVPLVLLVISSVVNVVLDYVLIVYGHMGVAGAAYATVFSQGLSGDLPYIGIIHGELTAWHSIETHEQIENGGLAGTGGTNDGNGLAGLCRHGDAVEDLFVGNVTEMHILKLYLTLCILQNHRICHIHSLRLLIQDAEYSLRRRKCRLQIADNVGKLVDGSCEFARILYELCHAAQGDEEQGTSLHHTVLGVHIQNTAHNREKGNGEVVDKVNSRAHCRTVMFCRVVCFHGIRVALIKASSDLIFPLISLNGPAAGQHFFRVTVQFAQKP